MFTFEVMKIVQVPSCGLHYVFKKDKLKSYSSVHQNVTLFGNSFYRGKSSS